MWKIFYSVPSKKTSDQRKLRQTKLSLLKQCFSRFSFDTIWWYFQLISAAVSLKISFKYHQVVSNEDRAKHCFKTEWALDIFDIDDHERFFRFELKLSLVRVIFQGIVGKLDSNIMWKTQGHYQKKASSFHKQKSVKSFSENFRKQCRRNHRAGTRLTLNE